MTSQKSNQILTEENNNLKNQLQRLGADFANYQRRTLKEKESWGGYLVSEMVLKLLPALDSLDILTGQGRGLFPGPDSVWEEGVRLVREEFVKFLGQYDITKIEPQEGDKFDPAIHCCISVVDAPVEGELVGYVIRSGYSRGSSVIRAADVIVRKNTQKSA